MEIEPKYVTFEQAKWLKEKGFNLPTLNWYHRETKKFNTNDLLFSMNKLTDNYSAPEQWQVVEWLRVNHNIEVNYLRYTYHGGKYQGRKYMWMVEKYDEKYNHEIEEDDNHWLLNERESEGFDYNSPQEAYSAAFEYLKESNLI